MTKKSGSKSSRSERRAGRQRAERAREHGLPARVEPPPRARALTPEPSDDGFGEARSSGSPSSHVAKPAIPTLVKVIGGALVILTGVYFLSRQRDQALTGPQPADSAANSAVLVTPAPPEARAEPLAEPPAVVPPAADPPALVPPAAEPSSLAPSRAATVSAAPAPAAAAPAPKPALPQAPAPRPDNPY